MRLHLSLPRPGLIAGLSLALAMTPQALRAETFGIKDGVYDAYNCAAEESDQRISLDKGMAEFYGFACKFSDPRMVAGIEGAVLVSAACDGEGDSWKEGMMLLQTRDGGISLVTSAWGDHYDYCE